MPSILRRDYQQQSNAHDSSLDGQNTEITLQIGEIMNDRTLMELAAKAAAAIAEQGEKE